MTESQQPKICDYEGSNYRTDFWEGKGRDYEDRIERNVIRRMLPSNGKRLLEIGAGFGRLTDEYHAFEQVVLLDYSFSQLQYAQEHHGKSDRFVYVAADAYKLPFRPGVFDAATMIRVIHHMANVPNILEQVRRVLITDATFILEYANKRNMKAMLRYALKQQDWSPYSIDPVEFVELNFDFHPKYIQQELETAGFATTKRIPLSFFRLGILKNNFPTGLLAGLDGILQRSGLLYAPSIFTSNQATSGETANNINTDSLFVCPETGGELIRDGDTLTCADCGARYAVRDGIYDFKKPLE